MSGQTRDPGHVSVALDRLEETQKFKEAAAVCEDVGQIERAIANHSSSRNFLRAAELCEQMGDDPRRDNFIRKELEQVYGRHTFMGGSRVPDEAIELARSLGDDELLLKLQRAPLMRFLSDEYLNYPKALEFAKTMNDPGAERIIHLAEIEESRHYGNYKGMMAAALSLTDREEQQDHLKAAFRVAVWHVSDQHPEDLFELMGHMDDKAYITETFRMLADEAVAAHWYERAATMEALLGNHVLARDLQNMEVDRILEGGNKEHAARKASQYKIYNRSDALFEELASERIAEMSEKLDRAEQVHDVYTADSFAKSIRDTRIAREVRRHVVELYERVGKFDRAEEVSREIGDNERAQLYFEIRQSLRTEGS